MDELLPRLRQSITEVVQRMPPPDDPTRWKHHVIAGTAYQAAQPVTFTPYASARPCSARCRFCSEALRDGTRVKPAASIRPHSAYFSDLGAALTELEGLPLSFSLSGLEATDDVAWLEQVLHVLQAHAQRSVVDEKVLYTNAAGLTDPKHGLWLMQRLAAFGLDWIECSRHHFDENANQSIMRFRGGIAAADQHCFEQALRLAQQHIQIKLVCVAQHGGIDSPRLVTQYLEWAARLGIEKVIFREFSKLDSNYISNATARYVADTRCSIARLLEQCLDWSPFAQSFQLRRATEGYYFWNVIGTHQGIEVVFEASDYALMNLRHQSGCVYKLVFHPNGNLCAGWNPQRDVLLPARSSSHRHE